MQSFLKLLTLSIILDGYASNPENGGKANNIID